MKTTSLNIRRKAGMTLLEVNSVILVVLCLIIVLIIGTQAWKRGASDAAVTSPDEAGKHDTAGTLDALTSGARAWKKGSYRATNLMNLRNCQQAMRGHQNTHQLAVGDAFTQTMLEDYMKFPDPVATVTYTAGTVITATGTLWLVPSADGQVGGDYGFKATSDYSEW